MSELLEDLQGVEEEYRAAVVAAARGEPVDGPSARSLCTLTGRTATTFGRHVAEVKRRLAAVADLRRADALTPEIQKLAADERDQAARLRDARAKAEALVREAAEPLAGTTARLKDLRVEQRDSRRLANQTLLSTGDPAILMRIAELTHEKTNATHTLDAARENHAAGVLRGETVVAGWRRQFDNWRAGRSMGLTGFGDGRVSLPPWLEPPPRDTSTPAPVPAPTPERVMQASGWLEELEKQHEANVARLASMLADAERALAEIDAAIAAAEQERFNPVSIAWGHGLSSGSPVTATEAG